MFPETLFLNLFLQIHKLVLRPTLLCHGCCAAPPVQQLTRKLQQQGEQLRSSERSAADVHMQLMTKAQADSTVQRDLAQLKVRRQEMMSMMSMIITIPLAPLPPLLPFCPYSACSSRCAGNDVDRHHPPLPLPPLWPFCPYFFASCRSKRDYSSNNPAMKKAAICCIDKSSPRQGLGINLTAYRNTGSVNTSSR